MPSPKRLTYVLVGLVFLQAGCGFQLRGSSDVSPAMHETFVKGAAVFSELYIELKKHLERAGSKVMGSADIAASILTIHSEQLKRRVLTVDAQGRASEYELTYEISFDLVSRSGEVLVSRQTISTLRDYKFDPTNVLAKDTEEAQLRKALIATAVQQMLRRIDASIKQVPAATPAS